MVKIKKLNAKFPIASFAEFPERSEAKFPLAKVQGIPRNVSEVKFLVSACLSGINCTYNGKNNLSRPVKELVEKGKAIPICPEVMGSLPVPRENCEIVGGSGQDVLDNKAKVITTSGRDVSKNFIKGAKKAICLLKKYKIREAILKSKSPSCGAGQIYDGTFKNVLKKGDGVLAALLRRKGIKVYTESSASCAKNSLNKIV